MRGLWLRLLAAVASACLFISIFTAPRPDGFLDHSIWPLAYGLSGVASLAIAVRPRLIFLHFWASLIITIQLFRAVLLGLNPLTPSLRWASVTSNLFFAILAYFVWAGWKDRFVIEEALAQSHTTPNERKLAELEQVIAGHDTQTQPLQSPLPEQEQRYRLPTVPGL